MKTSDFDFDLPQELIAQTPLADRSASRMMVVDRATNSFSDHHFTEIIDYLRPDDIIVRNNTKVIPARLYGFKPETEGHVEVLLLKQHEDDVWECLVGNARIVHLDTLITFGQGQLQARCVKIGDAGVRWFKMIYQGIFMEVLDQLGEVPLPPYIKAKLQDPDRYQTVYAKVDGSAAAPTAGLHFTPEVIEKIQAKGIKILDITLQIGLGTFRPVEAGDIKDHIMHSEFYDMSAEVAKQLNEAKANGHRIVAIGTTSVRTLEAIYSKYGTFKECHEATDIFIFPGYQFKAVDVLLTNFHLPKSTLIMLVSAMAGKDLIFAAYNHAVEQRYRFFSFGDCMLIL